MSLELSRGALRRARIRDSLPTEHPGEWDQIVGLVGRLPEPQDLSDDQVVGSMAQAAAVRNRLDAYLTGLAGQADTRTLGQVYRAGTAGTLVAAATTANPAVGSGAVGAARALRDLPHVEAAYRDGLISVGHVHALTHAAPRITDFAGHEQALVTVARRVEPVELRRLLDVLIGQCLPEALDHDMAALRAKRGLALSELPNGLFHLRGHLDALEGRRLRDALAAFTDAPTPGDHRDPTQRRADALADLVSIAQAATRPLGVSGLTVLIDIDNLPAGLKAHLEDGTPLGPATFDLLSCTAAVACVFGAGRSGGFVPLAMARTARRATHHQWAALIARDRGCIRCGRHPRACQAHHIVHWRHGGLTDVSNMVLMCARCHRDLHAGLYTVTMGTDGIPELTVGRGPPSGQAL